MSKQRTITLTSRAPVKINEDEWPIISEAYDSWHDGQIRHQAIREHSRFLAARRHRDGRAIVYGVDTYNTRSQDESDYVVRRGVLLDASADLVGAIESVALDIAAAVKETDRIYPWGEMAKQCIAALPAEEI